jgi:acyl carrier protein
MEKENIIKILSEILKINEEELANIDDEYSLTLFSLNSIRSIELIMRLEEELNIEVGDEDLSIDKVDTISKIISLSNKYTTVT